MRGKRSDGVGIAVEGAAEGRVLMWRPRLRTDIYPCLAAAMLLAMGVMLGQAVLWAFSAQTGLKPHALVAAGAWLAVTVAWSALKLWEVAGTQYALTSTHLRETKGVFRRRTSELNLRSGEEHCFFKS